MQYKQMMIGAAVAVILAAAQASARPLGEAFSQFYWNQNETVIESFEVDLSEPAKIQVVDFKLSGDIFDVYDNGVLLGQTSSPIQAVSKASSFAATPEEAVGNKRFSQAVFEVASGYHEITIKPKQALEQGTAAVRIMPRVQLAKNKAKRGHKDDDDDDDHKDDHHHGKHDHDKHKHRKDVHTDTQTVTETVKEILVLVDSSSQTMVPQFNIVTLK